MKRASQDQGSRPPFQGGAEPARRGVVASLQLYRLTLCHCEERQRRGNLSDEIATSLRSSR